MEKLKIKWIGEATQAQMDIIDDFVKNLELDQPTLKIKIAPEKLVGGRPNDRG